MAAAWRRDAATRDPAATLFCRGWLERDLGEAYSPSQAASWVDIKRTYIEMRKSLRWVYMALMNPAPYGEAATRLGFRPLTEATVDIGGVTLYSFVLDMGPGSVDGWLANLVGAEIAEQGARASDLLLDIDARELVLASGRGLTALEFGVMRHCRSAPERRSLVTTSWKRSGDIETQPRAMSSMWWSSRFAASSATRLPVWRPYAALAIGTETRAPTS